MANGAPPPGSPADRVLAAIESMAEDMRSMREAQEAQAEATIQLVRMLSARKAVGPGQLQDLGPVVQRVAADAVARLLRRR